MLGKENIPEHSVRSREPLYKSINGQKSNLLSKQSKYSTETRSLKSISGRDHSKTKGQYGFQTLNMTG